MLFDSARQTVKRHAAPAAVIMPNPLERGGPLDDQLANIFVAALEWSAARKAQMESPATGPGAVDARIRFERAGEKLQAEVDR